MLQLTAAGRIGKDAELRTTPNAKKVCSFSIATDVDFGDRKKTIWVNCSLWGKRGEALSQYLIKGTSVTAVGEMSTREYDGKTYVELNVREIALQGGAKPSAASESKDNFSADLNDEVPF